MLCNLRRKPGPPPRTRGSWLAVPAALVLASAGAAQTGSPPAGSPTARTELIRLAPFVGGVWEAEGTVPGAGRFSAERRYDWVLDSAFVRVRQRMSFESGQTVEEEMLIGWDPAQRRVQLWSFASDGSWSEGYEVRDEDPRRWTAEGRTQGARSSEWRITSFLFEDDAFSMLIEIRSGREFVPGLTLAFRRRR